METQFGISNVNTYLFEMDNFTPPIFEDHLGKKDLCCLESAKDVSVLLERNEDKLSEMSVLVRNVTRVLSHSFSPSSQVGLKITVRAFLVASVFLRSAR